MMCVFHSLQQVPSSELLLLVEEGDVGLVGGLEPEPAASFEAAEELSGPVQDVRGETRQAEEGAEDERQRELGGGNALERRVGLLVEDNEHALEGLVGDLHRAKRGAGAF